MVKSFKGREVNLDALMEGSGGTLAVGNMRVNARGDLIGKNGKILKTREQLENEYIKNNPNAVKQREEDSVGFNKELAAYQDKVHSEELAKASLETTDDPYKKTTIDDKNLSTSATEEVKFVDLNPQEEETVSLEDVPFDDDDQFEIDVPEAKEETEKAPAKKKVK